MDDKQFHGPYSFNLNEAYNVHILVHYKELCTQLVIPKARVVSKTQEAGNFPAYKVM